MASAEHEAREGHLWALRGDPGFCTDAMEEASGHRQEMPLHTGGHRHPTLKKKGRPLFWNHILSNVFFESQFGFALFDEIVRHINNLAVLHPRHYDQI